MGITKGEVTPLEMLVLQVAYYIQKCQAYSVDCELSYNKLLELYCPNSCTAAAKCMQVVSRIMLQIKKLQVIFAWVLIPFCRD